MRRSLLLAVTAVLVTTGVALAALPYKTGIYTAGSQSAKGAGVTFTVKTGSFSVSRISFTETCSNAERTFSEPITFKRGSRASLTGRISSTGRFSGKYVSSDGSMTVSGRVLGSTATIKGTSAGTFTPTGESLATCKGSRTFRAKRLIIST